MKITETVTRDCCDPMKDLKLVNGCPPGQMFFFCIHCGRYWANDGSELGGLACVLPPWEWGPGKAIVWRGN